MPRPGPNAAVWSPRRRPRSPAAWSPTPATRHPTPITQAKANPPPTYLFSSTWMRRMPGTGSRGCGVPRP